MIFFNIRTLAFIVFVCFGTAGYSMLCIKIDQIDRAHFPDITGDVVIPEKQARKEILDFFGIAYYEPSAADLLRIREKHRKHDEDEGIVHVPMSNEAVLTTYNVLWASDVLKMAKRLNPEKYIQLVRKFVEKKNTN